MHGLPSDHWSHWSTKRINWNLKVQNLVTQPFQGWS
jgi:hypothetical protein